MNPLLRAQMLRKMQAQYQLRLQQAQILSQSNSGTGYISAEQQCVCKRWHDSLALAVDTSVPSNKHVYKNWHGKEVQAPIINGK
ncbi:MAG: hypothetical protein QM703_13945 [Gemmatales bacterium]